ncbi:hypothetical protein Tco_1343142 [Tanacetum coccineum]
MASFEGGGCLEDPPFVASLLDTKGYFKEVECFMCPGLALDFVPWGTLSTLEEGLGALNATGLFAEHIANMWVIKGGSSGLRMMMMGVCGVDRGVVLNSRWWARLCWWCGSEVMKWKVVGPGGGGGDDADNKMI